MQDYEELSKCLDRLMESVRLFVKKENSKEQMASSIQNEVHHLTILTRVLDQKIDQ